MAACHELQVIYGLSVTSGKIGTEDRAVPDANA